jgi:7-cyano-7-deazaguanine synthase in queuosine biosynthesis
MRRHSIIARLGPTDTTRIAAQVTGSVVTEIRFIDGERRLGFGLGQMTDQLTARGIIPSDAAIDLGLLAATVNAADTRISRAIDSQDTWTREIDLYIPVQDPDLWNGAAELVQRTLRFLTGDRWRLFVRARHRDYKTLVERPATLIAAPFSSVCLFSGGLDSFVGAIDLVTAGEKPIFVSYYWDASTSTQTLCAQRIGKVYGDMEPRHVRARVGFSDDLVQGSAPEKTQRGRSFLFLALAALAASGLDGRTPMYLPENGLISLNIPLDPLRVGAWSTRTTHPFYVARWQQVLGRLGISSDVVNAYRFKTKGEMLSECANTDLLKKCVGETISCSSVTKARWKGLAPGHCGYCVPCLIRRAAIAKAFQPDPTIYTIPDLAGQVLNSRSPEGEHVRSFQMMARRLVQRPALSRILVHETGPLSDYSDAETGGYADVFRRGIEEVGEYVNAVFVRPG